MMESYIMDGIGRMRWLNIRLVGWICEVVGWVARFRNVTCLGWLVPYLGGYGVVLTHETICVISTLTKSFFSILCLGWTLPV